MIKNTLIDYGSIAKIFHWSIAVLIISLVTAGLVMTEMSPGPLKWQIYGIHKATGVIVFCLALGRLIWRWMNPIPQLDKDLPLLIKWSATNNIRLLYVLMILYPLSGFLMSVLGGHEVDIFGLYTIKPFGQYPDIAKKAHFLHIIVFEYLLIFSFGAHVLGALYHHFIRKDRILKRMTW